jgi:twitching motility protein PilT
MTDQKLPLLGRIAVQLKMIEKSQLHEALLEQGRSSGKSLGDILVQMGFVDPSGLEHLAVVQKDLIAKHRARKAAELKCEAVPVQNGLAASGGSPAHTSAQGEKAEAVTPAQEIVTADANSDAGLELRLPATGDAEVASLGRVLADAKERGASDIHLHAGGGLRIRVHGALSETVHEGYSPEVVEKLVSAALTPAQRAEICRDGELDFCFDLPGVGRYRANAYRQQRGFDVVFRSISAEPPTLEGLGLPGELARYTNYHQGMVLVTGPAGCGKSTTLAAMVNLINQEREEHILTVEDPIEVVHPSQGCIVNQRHAGQHSESFARALRGALREDPDVIVIGELRDLETISLAMTAAETGHFVLASLHTNNSVRTINRMIGAFPSAEQGQVRTMLSESLRAVISQRLVVRADGEGRVPALEVLVINKAIGNLIREEKTVQIRSSIQTGKAHGMYLLEQSLNDLVAEGTISRETALELAEEKKLITAGA